jgi:hypothetical protein
MTFRELPDIDALRKLLGYDEASGLLFWLPRPHEMFATESAAKSWNTKYANKVAGSKTSEGYTIISVLGVSYMAHRLAWVIANKKLPDGEIDHINGDRNDNRAKNLRVVSAQENSRNAKKQKNNTTGHTGVYWDKTLCKYVALIGLNGRLKNLGRFETVDEAVTARLEAQRRYNFSSRHGT